MIAFSATLMDRQRLAAMKVAPESIADDGKDYTAILVEKPWGFEVQTRATADFAATRLELLPGRETSMHCHPNKTVVLLVERGLVWFETLLEEHHMPAGNGALVEKGVFHRLRAGANGAAVVEIEWPPNKKDLVRLQDKHGRTGKGYEDVEHATR